MQLQLQTFSTVVGNTVAAIQGAATRLLDLTVGSTLRAIVEANASLALWMQWLMVLVLRTTRAATSTGPDLDTWVADFGLARVAAVVSSGVLTFSRFSPVVASVVPVGTLVKTSDGTQSFTVVADDTYPNFVLGQNGAASVFTVAAGTASVTVPAFAAVAGSAGNVQPATITLIAAALPGIDTVSNPAAFTGGLDAESDATLRDRFSLFLASRSRATPAAIAFAAASVQQGLTTLLVENQTPDGAARPGTFTFIVDDGSGNPPAALLASISTAIEAVRPVGASYAVQPPTVLRPAVSMTLTTAPGANHAAVVAEAVAALYGAIGQLPIGGALSVTRAAAIAYAADPAVTNVASVTLNGLPVDFAPPPLGVVKPGAIVVT